MFVKFTSTMTKMFFLKYPPPSLNYQLRVRMRSRAKSSGAYMVTSHVYAFPPQQRAAWALVSFWAQRYKCYVLCYHKEINKIRSFTLISPGERKNKWNDFEQRVISDFHVRTSEDTFLLMDLFSITSDTFFLGQILHHLIYNYNEYVYDILETLLRLYIWHLLHISWL